ncbi:superoxide dismutase[Cu-Zn] [Swaminathania salitolerans]|uniref:Superoxide dismutase [Cu-Zn] n=1 Tax=Swaminathania salitolerans TaxID=182838 RepID=A0A511BSJ3_9PROT|nr:superoxide dismutase family protein [Swaminathania salitolerans]GBQ11649.1 Cu/Zn superoxide dismutase [Swaminathania salitolerans LMG 21291]GEL02574.1 superoxide dismutase [Cu-Zn] [Swaminathania salitolerans]
MRFALPVMTTLLLLSGAVTGLSVAQAADSVHGTLIGPEGKPHGTVTVTEAPRGVIVRVVAEGLPPGWHGMHFHETGACTPPGFTSAKGHVHHVTPVIHGFMTPHATDDGDLPNLHVDRNGAATVELYSTLVSLHGTDGRPALEDADGSALVIHARPDDYTTQPIGGSAGRIACAVLKGQ